jgi:hypothetical protein
VHNVPGNRRASAFTRRLAGKVPIALGSSQSAPKTGEANGCRPKQDADGCDFTVFKARALGQERPRPIKWRKKYGGSPGEYGFSRSRPETPLRLERSGKHGKNADNAQYEVQHRYN